MYKKGFLMFAALVFSVAALAANKQYVLGVDGLACPFCAFGIEKRLNKIDGVTEVQVDIGESVVKVTLEEGKPFTEAQARQAVNEAGFTLRSYAEAESEAGGSRAN
ncbi:heavy-metal-associated domain-containing protein [Marinobacter sp.]|uniref:heavy-metal-associated domain-containing protein n=1 Tax=Marinobacter sp. TaxID=50741 RepID=UPI003B522EE7